MDFTEINSPADLFNYQEERTNKSSTHNEVVEKLFATDPTVGLEVVKTMVKGLIKYHYDVVEQYQNEGDVDSALTWQFDASTLMAVKKLLDEVVI